MIEAKKAFHEQGLLMARQHAIDMETPLEKMVRDWQDSTKQMNDATARWTEQSIDMMAEFLVTGKGDFKSFVESIRKDLMRMQLRELFSSNGGADFMKKIGDSVKGMIYGPGRGGINSVSQAAPTADADNQGGEDFYGNISENASVVAQANTAISALGDKVGSAVTGMGSWLSSLLGMGSSTVSTSSALMTVSSAAMSAAAALQMVGNSGGGGMLSKGGDFVSSVFGMGGGASGAGMGGAYDLAALAGVAFKDGGIMSNYGSLALKRYANGGIANSAQLAMFGEGDMNEAYVPLPDGRSIPVTMKGGRQQGGQTMIFNLPGIRDAKEAREATAHLRRGLGAAVNSSKRYS
jgi:hypothetical protein